MTDSYLLIGAGYSARAFARSLPAGAQLAGTTRTSAGFARLETAGIRPLAFDGSGMPEQFAAAMRDATHIVLSAAPDAGGDPLLRLMPGGLRGAAPALQWIGYLSTVGVYGDHEGHWIDEDALCRPRPGRSDFRLETERAWQAAADEAGVPLAILRLSGIYGPGRNALVNLAAGTARRIIKPGQVFNRIHVADIVGALSHLAAREQGGVFNVTDDEPSPPQDVVEYAAALMGVEPPPEIAFEDAGLSPMARSFYGELKRVSNKRIKDAGYVFRCPHYRAAFDAMWRDGSWKAEA